jgi:hypothetical protein
MKGVRVNDPPPHIITGDEVRAQVEALVLKERQTRFEGYGVQHAWAQKSACGGYPICKIFFHITLM